MVSLGIYMVSLIDTTLNTTESSGDVISLSSSARQLLTPEEETARKALEELVHAFRTSERRLQEYEASTGLGGSDSKLQIMNNCIKNARAVVDFLNESSFFGEEEQNLRSLCESMAQTIEFNMLAESTPKEEELA